MPSDPNGVAPTHPIAVASYNIHSGRGRDGVRAPDRIARVLREIDADIVGLQEVDWRPDDRLAGDSQADYFADLSSYRALSGPNVRDHRGHFGNVLLTRLPVLEFRTHDVSLPGREPRGAIEAVLETRAGLVRAVATHFGLKQAERRLQAHRVADIVRRDPDLPLVLLGDFNEWRIGSRSLAPLSAVLDRGRHPRSYPARVPALRLDRIYWRRCTASGAVSCHRSPISRIASDHLPVMAMLVPEPGKSDQASASCARCRSRA